MMVMSYDREKNFDFILFNKNSILTRIVCLECALFGVGANFLHGIQLVDSDSFFYKLLQIFSILLDSIRIKLDVLCFQSECGNCFALCTAPYFILYTDVRANCCSRFICETFLWKRIASTAAAARQHVSNDIECDTMRHNTLDRYGVVVAVVRCVWNCSDAVINRASLNMIRLNLLWL